MYNSANAIFGQILYQSRLSKYSHINYICSVLSIRLFLVFVSNLAFALVISLKNISLTKTVAIAELGLLGELRMPSLLEKRIKEAIKLGFTKVITPKNYKNVGEIANSVTSH